MPNVADIADTATSNMDTLGKRAKLPEQATANPNIGPRVDVREKTCCCRCFN